MYEYTKFTKNLSYVMLNKVKSKCTNVYIRSNSTLNVKNADRYLNHLISREAQMSWCCDACHTV